MKRFIILFLLIIILFLLFLFGCSKNYDSATGGAVTQGISVKNMAPKIASFPSFGVKVTVGKTTKEALTKLNPKLKTEEPRCSSQCGFDMNCLTNCKEEECKVDCDKLTSIDDRNDCKNSCEAENPEWTCVKGNDGKNYCCASMSACSCSVCYS